MEIFNKQIEEAIMNKLNREFGFEVFTPGLERSRPIYLKFIEDFKKQGTKIITIGGTNGKGQTAHTLKHLMTTSGKRIALWTSPHILSIRERFEVDKEQISYKELLELIDEGINELKMNYAPIKVSFYEFLFLIFLKFASKKGQLDFLILEVGVGGRLDAVNHFDADCAAIASISRDHQVILGERYEQILDEKLGISRPNNQLFTNFRLHYLIERTQKYAENGNIKWKNLSQQKNQSYIEDNQNLALEVFLYFYPELNDFAKGSMTQVPLFKGRREEMTINGNSFIFIGAHNTDGMRKMVDQVLANPSTSKHQSILVSFSKRPHQELIVMCKTLKVLAQNGSELKLTFFDHPKAVSRESLKELLDEQLENDGNKGLFKFVEDWKSYIQDSRKQTFLVCGSYYFIGEVQSFLHDNFPHHS